MSVKRRCGWLGSCRRSSRRARACPSPCHDRGGQAPALRARKGSSFRSFRTLMSIVRGAAMLSRSFRTLIFQTGPVVFTLRSSRPFCAAGALFYRHAGPNGPEEMFSRVRALQKIGRACPSPCFGLPNDRGGQAPALRYREVFLAEERPPSP